MWCRGQTSVLLWIAAALVACGGPSVDRPGVSFDGGSGTCVPNAENGGLEVCNGMDDDCDGFVDESPSGGPLRRACESTCGGGTEECMAGGWGQCTARAPTLEECNGVDDDCDEEVDEGCECVHGETRPCGTNIGACREGIQQCVSGQWLEACHGEVRPVAEMCNNGQDDDCNMRIDEDCQCAPGETQPCGTDEGQCVAGSIVCGNDGRWGETCQGELAPRTEVCDGQDDDCDGATDWTTATGFGWRADAFESNETCTAANELPNAVEGGPWIAIPVADSTRLITYPTLYPNGDQDWYRFRAETVSHTCFPGTSQCAFVVTVQLELADPAARDDYQVCVVATSGCGTGTPDLICSSPTRWVESASSYVVGIKWGGTCGADDSRDVRVVVRSTGQANACGYYQLHARFRYDTTEACP